MCPVCSYGEDAEMDARSDQARCRPPARPPLSSAPFPLPPGLPTCASHVPPLSLLPPQVQVQRAVLDAELPDFVVFSGDMASGWVCAQTKPACPPGWYEARWRQLIAPVQAAGIPYAIILGNHE